MAVVAKVISRSIIKNFIEFIANEIAQWFPTGDARFVSEDKHLSIVVDVYKNMR